LQGSLAALDGGMSSEPQVKQETRRGWETRVGVFGFEVDRKLNSEGFRVGTEGRALPAVTGLASGTLDRADAAVCSTLIVFTDVTLLRIAGREVMFVEARFCGAGGSERLRSIFGFSAVVVDDFRFESAFRCLSAWSCSFWKSLRATVDGDP